MDRDDLAALVDYAVGARPEPPTPRQVAAVLAAVDERWWETRRLAGAIHAEWSELRHRLDASTLPSLSRARVERLVEVLATCRDDLRRRAAPIGWQSQLGRLRPATPTKGR